MLIEPNPFGNCLEWPQYWPCFSSQGWCTTRSLPRAWSRWTCRGRWRRRAPPTLASTRCVEQFSSGFWSKLNKEIVLQACFVGFSLCAFLKQALSFIPSDGKSSWGTMRALRRGWKEKNYLKSASIWLFSLSVFLLQNLSIFWGKVSYHNFCSGGFPFVFCFGPRNNI